MKTSLENLYNETEQLKVSLSDKDYTFSVILMTRGKPDCKISSFKANLYGRTRNGMNYKKYTTLAGLKKSVSKWIKNNVDSQGEISFSTSTEIHKI
jgi:hypothetical protein